MMATQTYMFQFSTTEVIYNNILSASQWSDGFYHLTDTNGVQYIVSPSWLTVSITTVNPVAKEKK
jgi:hypothetical protein